MTRNADRLDRIEETLAALVEAVNAAGDEAAGRQAETMRALGHLDTTVAELAEAVQVVMAARADPAPVVPGKRLATPAERSEGSGA